MRRVERSGHAHYYRGSEQTLPMLVPTSAQVNNVPRSSLPPRRAFSAKIGHRWISVQFGSLSSSKRVGAGGEWNQGGQLRFYATEFDVEPGFGRRVSVLPTAR